MASDTQCVPRPILGPLPWVCLLACAQPLSKAATLLHFQDSMCTKEQQGAGWMFVTTWRFLLDVSNALMQCR